MTGQSAHEESQYLLEDENENETGDEVEQKENNTKEQFGDSEAVQESAQKSQKEEDTSEQYPSVPFYRLYRFATCTDIFLLVFGALCACMTGFIAPISNITFGRVAKIMIDEGSAAASDKNHTCPPPMSNKTSQFMQDVELFVKYQTGLGCIIFLLGFLMVMCYNISAENQIFRLRLHYFSSLLKQDIGWFDEHSKRNFSTKIVEDMLKIQTALGEKIPLTIFCGTNFIALFGTSFYYGWKLSAVMLAGVPLVILVVVFEGYVSSKLTTLEQQSYSDAGSVADEVLTNIKTVMAFNGQEKEAQRYSLMLEKARKASVKKGILLGLTNGAAWGIYFLNYALAFWFGTLLIVQGRKDHTNEYSPDILVICLFGLVMGSWYIGSTAQYFEAFGAGLGAARPIFPVLSRVPAIDSSSTEGLKPTEKATGALEFSSVNFSYPTRPDVQILKNISLKIQPKSTVAIVGASGSGKSASKMTERTLIQLIQRFYDPQEGVIKLDGIDIRKLNVEWLRSQIGIVSQEPVLFTGSIADNIKLGLKDSTEEQMKEAAVEAYAHQFVTKFPNAYETETGQRGMQLSGGEKQRIAISRAIIRNPPILLLDEATSALDLQSEAIVQEALRQAKAEKTTIIIAHRLSTIKSADCIVVINDGQVCEMGSHEELMEKRGAYYNLVNTQESTKKKEENCSDLLQTGDVESEEIQGLKQSSKLLKQPFEPEEEDTVKNSLAIQQEEEIIKKEFKMRQFIRLCLEEWKYMLASIMFTVCKSAGLPFFSVLFGGYLGLFTSSDNSYISKMGNLYSLSFLILAIIIGVMSFFQRVFGNCAEYKLTLRMRKKLFGYVLQQDMAFFDEKENNVGQLTSRLSTDCTSIQGAAGSRFVGLTQAVTIIVLSAIISFYFLPKMAAVTFGFVPLVVFSSFIEGRVLGNDNLVEKESIERAATVAVEALNQIRTVVSLGVESNFHTKYTDTLMVAHKINLKRAWIRGAVFGFVYAVPYFAYSLSLLYGGYLVEQECADIGDVFKVAEALIFGTMSAGGALAFAPDADKAKIAAARIMKLLQRKPTIVNSPGVGLQIREAQGSIIFDDVNFDYSTRQESKILRGLTFKVTPGQKIALVGPSGSGKSASKMAERTCIQLILRFYDAVSGQVKLDGVDLTALNVNALRNQMAIVAQEPALFDRTLAENIAYGDNSREVSMDEIIQAARQANIHNFISSLPEGYETRVGNMGNQLSGGEKQRVAISRALIRSPKLLLLDEATSALDSRSEFVVQSALSMAMSKESLTSLTVAHRLSSIKDSDLILVMRDGQIIEAGTHNDLLEKQGFYYAMYYAQENKTNLL